MSESTIRDWDRAGRHKATRHPVNQYRLYDKSELSSLLRDAQPQRVRRESVLERAPFNAPLTPGNRPTDTASPSDDIYTVTLDDYAVVTRFIQKILGIPSLGFATLAELKKQADRLRPVGAFIDIHLADGKSGLERSPRLRLCLAVAASTSSARFVVAICNCRHLL